MADTSKTPMTRAGYDARLIDASWEAIRRSYKLLDQTQPLVTATEGGSWIGAHLVDFDQRDSSSKS